MVIESPLNAANTAVIYTTPYPPTGVYRGTVNGGTVEFPAGNCVFRVKMSQAVRGFGLLANVEVREDKIIVSF